MDDELIAPGAAALPVLPGAVMVPAMPPADDAREAEAVRALAALAQPVRLRVFRTLVGAGPAGLTPGVLAAALALPPSSLSFHLKELSTAGLVAVQRQGRHLIYRPAVERMNGLVDYLTAHCCQGQDCGQARRPPACAPATTAAVPFLPRSETPDEA